MKQIHHTFALLCVVSAPLWFNSEAEAQPQIPSKTDLTFNRFYNYDEMTAALQQLVSAYPDLLTLQSLGKSEQGRELWLVTLNTPKTGPDTDKPAMWIDGNVHGNEIQAAETVLYSIWYLTKSYGQVDSLTQLVDRCAFYFLPMVNPDGRHNWFITPQGGYRSGLRPTDDDFDGLFDEDPTDDLNGDGHIGTMWRADPNGTHKRNSRDPRLFEPVEFPERGQWSRAGAEGIDNDGDGEINEDGAGGYDMNRNWPTDWHPTYIQFGAGEAPLDRPETRAIAEFIMARPNIAAGQSYHNAGGMILRGPGAAYLVGHYPRADIDVYDRLGRAGEEMLPFYRYMIIHADLYTVHGGFVNWLSEGLGIVSFTNELWTDNRILQRPEDGFGGGTGTDAQRARMRWVDRVLFGQTFVDWTEFDHPLYGKVLIGGNTKWSGRVPPHFMLEEECHRNFAFTMFHADNMPLLSFDWIEVTNLGGELWQITLEVLNERIIPTRLARADEKDIGMPDTLTLSGDGVSALASGRLNDRIDRTLEPTEHRRHMIVNDAGVPGEGRRTFRFIVTGSAGAPVRLKYDAEKARDVEQTIELRDTPS